MILERLDLLHDNNLILRYELDIRDLLIVVLNLLRLLEKRELLILNHLWNLHNDLRLLCNLVTHLVWYGSKLYGHTLIVELDLVNELTVLLL